MFEDNAVPQGTVHYMAPEVYKATGYDYSIDTYALGLILYRLMNRGREPFLPLPPHKVTREMYREANNRRLGAEPFPAPADASPEMAEVILRACAYDPADRFRSAEDMRRALAGCEKKHPAESSAKRIIDLIRKAVNDVFAEPETLELPMRRDIPDISSGSVISAVPGFIEMSVTDDMSSPMDAFFSAPGDL
jgi:serine/threonine protein kinase